MPGNASAKPINAEIKSVKKQRDGLTIEKRGLELRLSQVQVTPDLHARIKRQATEIRAKLRNPMYEQKRQLFSSDYRSHSTE